MQNIMALPHLQTILYLIIESGTEWQTEKRTDRRMNQLLYVPLVKEQGYKKYYQIPQKYKNASLIVHK